MKPCLLIVDDDLNVVRQLKWALHDHFEVIHALTRQEIESTVWVHKPVAVLIDLHLPPTLQTTETGIDFVRTLRRAHPDLLLIGISVSQDPHIPDDLKEAGASFFLQKPFSDDSFRVLMDRVV